MRGRAWDTPDRSNDRTHALFVFVDNRVAVLPKTGVKVHVKFPRDIRIAKGMLVAAGINGASVSTNAGAAAGTGAHIRLFFDKDASTMATVIPVPLRYDAEVLAALVPGATVVTGSILQAIPQQAWLRDEGVQIVRLAGASREGFVASHGRQDSITLAHDLGTINERPYGFGFGKRINLWDNRVRGVTLMDGDVVVSKGERWYYYDGSLNTHRPLVLSSQNVRVDDADVLTPRDPVATIGHALGDKIDLTLIWQDDGSKSRYDAVVRSQRPWALALNLRPPVVTDPMGTCFGDRNATVAECVRNGHIWDRPCTVDHECPYHDPRRARGGCNQGMCEMPLKVGNASFRVADAKTPAMMHDCPADDPSYPFCSQVPSHQALFQKLAKGVGYAGPSDSGPAE